MTDEGEMNFIETEKFSETTNDKPQTVTGVQKSGSTFTIAITMKVIPFALYIFSGVIIKSSIIQWVFTIVSSAANFWFTKNVAGRLILGMRWWSTVTDDNKTEWKFERANIDLMQNQKERKAFWISLFAESALWMIFSLISLIGFNFGWAFVTALTFSLSATNAWAFLKCDSSTNEPNGGSIWAIIMQNFLPFLVSSAKPQEAPAAAAVAPQTV